MAADLSPFALAIGHATDAEGGTGLTVVRGVSGPFRAAAARLGRATGTRELDAVSPHHLVDRIDAILLAGGSAYGLAAAAGVMRWMEERGRGFRVPGGVVPIVPAAVLFDLAPTGAFGARPSAQMAYDACERAVPTPVEEGSVGAGTGATVGKGAGPERGMKGGFGCAVASGAGLQVAAAVVVNAMGDVRDGAGRIIAGARADGGGFVDIERAIADGAIRRERFGEASPGNTTLAVVAVSAPMTRVALAELARTAGATLARRITPMGTLFDGDVVFAVSPVHGTDAPPLQPEALAARALGEAVERAVRLARGRDGFPGLSDDPDP